MKLKIINLCNIFKYIFGAIHLISCESTKVDKGLDMYLSVDSLNIIKNVFLSYEKETIDSSIYTYFGGEHLCLLLSCKLSNKNLDTLFIMNSRKYKYIYCIERNLIVRQKGLLRYYDNCQEMFDSKLDTFMPGDIKEYFIPFFGGPKIKDGDILYSTIRIRPLNFAESYTNIDSLIYFYNNRSVFNPKKSLVRIDIDKNEAHLVDSFINDVYEQYRMKGYNENVFN